MSRHLRRIERSDSARGKRSRWISVWDLTSDMLTPGMRGRMRSRHGTYEFTVGEPVLCSKRKALKNERQDRERTAPIVNEAS